MDFIALTVGHERLVKRLQALAGARRSNGSSAPAAGLVHDIVSAFEPDPAAHPSDGIDEKTNSHEGQLARPIALQRRHGSNAGRVSWRNFG